MSFLKKIWTDRVSENPTRRILKNVSTNEEIIVDVARNEGEISQEGDAFSAENMNDLEQRIAEEFTNVNSNLTADGTPFRFGKDDEGNFGYILTDETGADSVVPFSNDNGKLICFMSTTYNNGSAKYINPEYMELVSGNTYKFLKSVKAKVYYSNNYSVVNDGFQQYGSGSRSNISRKYVENSTYNILVYVDAAQYTCASLCIFAEE